MTHAEAVLNDRIGLEPSSCPGELELLAAHPDRAWEDGRAVERTVEVSRCEACGTRISMSGGEVLNAYAVPELGALVADLARSFTLPGR